MSNFLGHSANAVRWQVCPPLLVYVLLRYMAHPSQWGQSFTRLFAVSRSALWERLSLLELLKSYGTASARNHNDLAQNTRKTAIAILRTPKHGPCRIKAVGPC